MSYLMLLFSPFLAAPSFFSIFGNLAFISLLLMVSSFALLIIRNRFIPKGLIFPISAASLFVLYLLLSLLYHGADNRSLNYFVFYLFFSIVILSVSYHGYISNINYETVRKIIFLLFVFLFVFSIYEYYSILFNGGKIPWLPRYDREVYGSNSFSGLYRIRLFTYESSSAGALINTLYLMYFSVTSDHRLRSNFIILFLAVFLQIAIFSSTHTLYFIIIFLFQIIFSNVFNRKIKLTIFSVIFIIFISQYDLLYDIYQYIYTKVDGFIDGSNSSNLSSSERSNLMSIGISAFLDNPIFGGGLASFYEYVDTGLVNFHLQTLQQLGVLGYILFLCFLCFPILYFPRYKMEVKLLFICSWFTLFFSGSIWDSNLYLPYIFVNGIVNYNE